MVLAGKSVSIEINEVNTLLAIEKQHNNDIFLILDKCTRETDEIYLTIFGNFEILRS